jgi:hypothetical protein
MSCYRLRQTLIRRHQASFRVLFARGLVLSVRALLTAGDKQATLLEQAHQAYRAACDNSAPSGVIAEALSCRNP